jgi:hypothetical protein
MILKGNQRANGADLAVHLMNAFDNERVHIAQVRGAVASDLKGAFAEFEAVASGTRCTQPLYSLSINPSQPISRAQYDEAIEVIEQKLGLSGQPRVIVFHEKYGREHAHVVWSRVRVDTMRAIPMSHDHRKLCDLACDLAHRFGHELPPGLKAWEKKERFEKQKIEPTLGERAQAQKSGITPDERRAQITALYEQADSGTAFQAALAEAGYALAKGDRRGFVLVDQGGEVHSLSRYVAGHSAKKIRQKLSPLTPDELPDVDDIKLLLDEQAQAESAREREEDRQRMQAQREAAEAALDRTQRERRTKLTGIEQDLLTRQASEKMSLHAAQWGDGQRLVFRMRSAVADLIDRTPALRSVLGPLQKKIHLDPRARHALEWKALAQRHERERCDLEREKTLLSQVEARERMSLERWVTRNAVAARHTSDQLRKNFAEVSGRPREVSQGAKGGDSGAFADRLEEAAGAGAAASFRAGDLSAQFNESAAKRNRLGESDGSQIPQSKGDDESVQSGHEIYFDEEALKSWQERSHRIKGPEQSQQPGKGYGHRRDPGRDGGPGEGEH